MNPVHVGEKVDIIEVEQTGTGVSNGVRWAWCVTSNKVIRKGTALAGKPMEQVRVGGGRGCRAFVRPGDGGRVIRGDQDGTVLGLCVGCSEGAAQDNGG
jgi:hypothetical protein